MESRSKGLTHHWSFDQNLKDLVTNQSISIIGMTTFTENRLGEKSKAIRFGKSYASVPEGNYFATSELTIVTWAKFYELRNWSRIFEFRNAIHDDKNDKRAFLRFDDKGYLLFFIFDGVNNGIRIEKKFQLNTWVFISLTFKDSVAKAYIDGELINTRSFKLNYNITTQFNSFGKSIYNSIPLLNGDIAYVKFFDRELSQTEILAEMESIEDMTK